MVPRRDRLILLSLALLVAAWMVAETVVGGHTGLLLYLAPALALALPLVLGRYVGEEQLAGLAGRVRSHPRRRVAVVTGRPRSYARVMQRGGRLVASGMAKRPPPAATPLCRTAA